MKKSIKALIAIFVSICLILVSFLFSVTPIKKAKIIENSSIRREYDKEYTIILDNDIPLLSTISETDLCFQIYNEVNRVRVENGVGQLIWNEDLVNCAEIRAKECNTTWSHSRHNGEPWYTVNPDIMYGENLAKGYEDAIEIIQAWINSPTHKENLLYSDFKYIGIAKVNEYFACEFCY